MGYFFYISLKNLPAGLIISEARIRVRMRRSYCAVLDKYNLKRTVERQRSRIPYVKAITINKKNTSHHLAQSRWVARFCTQ
jgi:hypothetical protein